MPRFDGSGPQGRGPLTGRGAGYCRGSRFSGRGFGSGFGRGFGRGFRNFGFFDEPYNRPLTKEEEKKILEEDLKDLDEEKKVIETKLKELKG